MSGPKKKPKPNPKRKPAQTPVNKAIEATPENKVWGIEALDPRAPLKKPYGAK
jgi:hypothetical protein